MANFNAGRWALDQKGTSLVELLVSTAITVMIATVVASILLAVQGSQRVLKRMTDRYESIRLVADFITTDTRFAYRATCDFDYLRLYTSIGNTRYIQYQFADGGGSPDPANIHRVVVVGGSVLRDDVVAKGVIPVDWALPSEGSYFECTTGAVNRTATVHLLKAASSQSSPPIALTFTAYLRS